MLHENGSQGTGPGGHVTEEIVVALLHLCHGLRSHDGRSRSQPMRPPPIAELSERQRHVLQLLAQGLTDGHIARQLDISERTIRHEVGVMKELLAAPSRFQLGMAYAVALHPHDEPRTCPLTGHTNQALALIRSV